MCRRGRDALRGYRSGMCRISGGRRSLPMHALRWNIVEAHPPLPQKRRGDLVIYRDLTITITITLSPLQNGSLDGAQVWK